MKRNLHLDSFRSLSRPGGISQKPKPHSVQLSFIVIIFFHLFIFNLNIFNLYCQQPTQEWVRTYNGPAGGNDVLKMMTLDKFGSIYLTGKISDNGGDIATLKYDDNGNQLWTAIYHDPTGTMDEPTGLVVDTLGNSYVIGIIYSNFNPIFFILLKYNSSGSQLWLNKISYFSIGAPYGIAIDRFGNIYVASSNDNTAFISKYNSMGNSIWIRSYFETGRRSSAIKILTNDSNVFTMGISEQSFPLNDDYLTLKYDANGNFKWGVKYAGPLQYAIDYPKDFALDKFGNVIVTGVASSGSPRYNDYGTVKYNWNGVQQWVTLYNGPGNNDDLPFAINADNFGNTVVTGYGYWGGGQSGINYTTVKYNFLGDSLWVRGYNGIGNDDDVAYALAIDDSDNVYVTGRSMGVGTGWDYATLKYNTTGLQQWIVRYNGNGNVDEEAHFISLDNDSKIYVSGNSFGISVDFLTIKYSQTLGIMPNIQLIPESFQLFQNYPNPFNNKTKIGLQVTESAQIQIKVFDVTGRFLESIINNYFDTGYYDFLYDATTLSSGIYYYVLVADNKNVDIKKMVLIK